jgi:predicted HAD superfamily Cof-like phosphohydrolase
MSNANDVHEFTVETGNPCPDTPQEMTVDSVKFIIRMVISELDELACTVTASAEERDSLLHEALETRDKCSAFQDTYASKDELIGAQFDALVDSWYYSLNTAAKHGVNMSKIFDLVHKANMDKRDPATGKFLKREADGKIIKPVGWTSPDITGEITRQGAEGAWDWWRPNAVRTTTQDVVK